MSEISEMAIPDEFPASFDVKDRIVVITGASSGLGRTLAIAFARAGACVGLVGRDGTRLKSVAESLPGEHLILEGDVCDEAFNGEAVERVVSTFGRLDVWIANAGISPVVADVTSMRPDVWRSIIDTNLTGVFLGAQAAARVMETGSRILITGSVLGERAHRGLSAYSASKGALIALCKSMAIDLGPKGITVNNIQPGWFDSPLVTKWRADSNVEATLLKHTVFERLGGAADLPGLYLFLASAASGFITGTNIAVDGGYLLV
jgi:NAD(P)-dependent dehydrogenase (short-subunit alcohol dehydrogenase family)